MVSDAFVACVCGCLPLIVGWSLDRALGDPPSIPHPVVGFGKMIAFCERRFNVGGRRRRGGAGVIVALSLVAVVYVLTLVVIGWVSAFSREVAVIVEAVMIFYCLAGTTLVREVRAVFTAVDRSLDEGRARVGRIVGRDTACLTAQEVRTAALETLAENLNDGVVAPLFWYALLGVPGMMAYKMVNTLDSMIGYRTERFAAFGFFAARMDDAAGYIPARVTALLIVLVGAVLPLCGKKRRSLPSLVRFTLKYGRCHASPNSGWPEAAMAGVLDCRFGGTHSYFGAPVYKPFIGTNDRPLSTADMRVAVTVSRGAEAVMIVSVCVTFCLSAVL